MTNVTSAAACEHPARRLLPWFSVGQLSSENAQLVEMHLRTCASCRAEHAWDEQLTATLAATERVEYAPHAALQRFMTSLDEHEGAPMQQFREPRHEAKASRRFAAAAVVAALAVGLTSWLLVERTRMFEAPYITLTAPEPTVSAAQLRVVVKPEVALGDFAALLRTIDAQVVNGPSAAGVFTIALADERGADQALQQLRADPRVQFAEPRAAAATDVQPP